MDLETIVVVPSSCYRNGNLADLREERAVRTLPTRKDSFTRVVLALCHVAKYLLRIRPSGSTGEEAARVVRLARAEKRMDGPRG